MTGLYVLAHGQAALQPIMGLQWRLRTFQAAAKSLPPIPEVHAVYLRQLDEARADAARLESDALVWYQNLPEPAPLQDALDLISTVVADAFGWADTLPDAPKQEPKPSPYDAEYLATFLNAGCATLGISFKEAAWMPAISLGYMIARHGAANGDKVGRMPASDALDGYFERIQGAINQ